MRENLGECTAVVLRGVLFSSRSVLRLRGAEEDCPPRKSCCALLQYVALFGTAAAVQGLYRDDSHWRHAAGSFEEAWCRVGAQESVHQERCSLLPFSFVQGTRGWNGAGGGAAVWF